MDYSFSSCEYPTSYPLAARSRSSSTITGKDKQKSGGGGSSRRGNKLAVRLSTDAQSVAARERRHRISERFKILQSLVPGGSKMDTVSMLEEAIHYVKFLKTQIWLHQAMIMTSCSSVDAGSTNNNDHHSFLFLPPNTTTTYDLPAKPPVDDHDSYELQVMTNVVGDHQAQGFAPPPLLQPGFANFGPEFDENIPLHDATTLLY